MRIPLFSAAILILIAGFAGPVRADGPAGSHSLGVVDFPASCSPQARAELNHGIALLHHMTYPQARKAFEKASEIDPRCAMAHWGVAMTLFQPLWPTRPSLEQRRRGWEAVEAAQALQPATERESLYVAAAAAFFRDPDSPDYWERIRRWEQAMKELYIAYPRDPDAAAFYALAHLATTPANEVSTDHADRAARLLLAVRDRYPDHPGAMHYLVHASDVPGRESRCLEVVRRYDAAAPRNPHALHMPTHIYTRLGDWGSVIHGNLRAAEAALEHPAGERGEYVWDEFPHAIEYLVYAYLQEGADQAAAAQLERLKGTARLEPTMKTAFHIASTRARDALERRDWSASASLVPRDPPGLDWDRFAWPEAVTWFARGLGAARQGRLDEARRACQRLAELEGTAGRAGEQLFARQIAILRLEAAAWLAQAELRGDSAVVLMSEAAQLESATPKPAVTPAPTLPALELLGDLYSAQKRPAEALAAYRRSLALHPRRFNSVLGAARAARDAGDEPGALAHYRLLLEVAASGTRQPALDEARSFVARRP